MQLNFLKKSIYVFVVFYVITLAFYFPSRYAGFLTDFIGFEANYQKCGFIHYYDCSLMPNLRYLQHLFSYILCKTVGANTIYWYFLYCLFHALSAFFGFHMLKKIFKLYTVENASVIAFASALLFLVSPYQAEVVVWRVCIQYCFVSIALSVNILLLLSYFREQKTWKPILAFLIFAVNMFAIEQAAAIPPALFLIAIIITQKEENKLLKKSLAYFVIPQILFVGFYFLLSKLMYGKWIMHYGASAFDQALSFKTYTNFFTYLFKHVFLLRFIEDEGFKIKIFSFLNLRVTIIILSVLLVFVFYKLIKNHSQKNSKAGLYLMLILLYAVTMLPVIQLYNPIMLLSENDRVGYISSVFIFAVAGLILLDRKNKITAFFFGILLMANAFYLMKIVHYWEISNNIAYRFGENFNYYDKKEIIILGVPDNYKGIWVLRADNSALKEFIQFKLHKQVNATIDEIANYNQTAYDNAVNVKKENDSTLYVSFRQYGNWWWKGGLGMSSYENEKYKVIADEWCGYHLTIKNIQQHHYTILYPDHLQWKEFKF